MKFLKTGKVSALKQLQRLTGAPAASGKTLSRRNSYAQINRVRLTYGHRNPLNQIDYNESLESANWLILFNSFDSTESANCGAKRYADVRVKPMQGNALNSDASKSDREKLNRVLEEMFDESDMWLVSEFPSVQQVGV